MHTRKDIHVFREYVDGRIEDLKFTKIPLKRNNKRYGFRLDVDLDFKPVASDCFVCIGGEIKEQFAIPDRCGNPECDCQCATAKIKYNNNLQRIK